MLGALAMLAWLGIASASERRGFWGFANLFASAFRRYAYAPRGFEFATLSGTALWLLLYSLLGAGFAVLVRGRMQPVRGALTAIVFSMAWFYISFHWLWRHALPMVYLFYPERPVALGHVLYGICLGRQRSYLREEEPEVKSAPAQSVSPPHQEIQSGSSEPGPPGEAPI
jgi:hypothetical protein